MNYSIVDAKTNSIVNVIVWDGVSTWKVPDQCSAIKSDTSGIGWNYNSISKTFTNPVTPTYKLYD